MFTGGLMDVIKVHPLIDQILESWRGQIGDVYDGYRGHVFRMLNCCWQVPKIGSRNIPSVLPYL